jgi:hypothetical protein
LRRTAAEQAGRRIQARMIATGRADEASHHKGDDHPIEGWEWLPKDVIPVVAFLKAQAAQPDPEDPEPDPDDEAAVA